MALALASASRVHAVTVWDGGAGNLLWNDPVNWSPDIVPTAFDDVNFGTGPVGTIHLGVNQVENSLAFDNNFTLGDYGTNLTLTNTTGNVFVVPGVTATIDAAYAGPSLNLSGGGGLFLNNPNPVFAGNINVDGLGTTLIYRGEAPMPQYNGVNSSAEFGRGDEPSLGVTIAVKTITLTNGAEFKYLGAGNNPEANHKNLTISSGGGTINMPSGFTVWNLDDLGQLTSSAGNTFTKTGNGRLVIGGTMADNNTLAGDVVVNGGMLELNRLQAAGAANTRFAGITGTTSPSIGTNTLTLNNNGVLMLNSGTVGNLDVAALIANNGSVLATNGNGNEIGVRAGGNILTINGSVSLLHRDLYAPQTGRNFFINSDITGAGTLNILPSTQSIALATAGSRLVIQRASAASTFTGVFRLNENANLELNPRANAVIDVGKVLAGGDVEFAGWGGQLDLRDSDPAAANIKDYSDNEISITSPQAGNLNRISVTRATTATGTGHLINFGTLTMGNHRLGIEGNNGYIAGFADTASITGNALIEQRTAQLVFNNAVALAENAAGRTLTIYRNGAPNSAAVDVTSAGNISISNLNIAFGTLDLRGASGAIGTAFGGAAATITINGGDTATATRGNGLQGLLNLDSNGALLGVTAANNNNRISDTARVRMLGNSILRLTSLNNTTTTETIGTLNVAGGHALIDVLKTGTAPAPVGFTLNTLSLTNASTVNFTGTSLGLAGANTSRIVIPGTLNGFLTSPYHSGNEWAKYDSALETGVEIGVTPFVAADYTINPLETALLPGQQTKYNGTTGITLTASRNTDRLNLQFSAANQAINTGGFVLSLNQGGLLNSANLAGITGTAGVGGLTAGTTAPSQLYVHNATTLELLIPVTDNLGANGAIGGGDDSAVDFVKSGTGTVILSNPSRTVGQAQIAGAPFANAGYTGMLTGSWIINDGVLNVHRGQYLGGRPIILNGGTLEINHPVAIANANSILPGWGNNVTVNGNSTIGMDDNGESNDANVGGNTIALLGSLTINNNATLGFGSFNSLDAAFMGGATLNGRSSINLGIGRTSSTNNTLILGGVVGGSGGLDVLSSVATATTLVLGSSAADTTNNTFNDAIIAYGGSATLRLNKANGFDAIPNTAAAEDLVINGSIVAWGPGHFGDFTTTNDINITNNGLFGIAPTSPAAIKNAGQNQINDNATVTLLLGTLGEADRINNDKWAVLNQKNGTFNVGLGTIEVGTANISGGGFNIDRGGTFKAGTLNFLPGAYNPAITTGLPVPGSVTTLEVGAGGINFSGQTIQLGSGSSGNVAGSGAVLKLGGNVTVVRSNLVGFSDARTGIEVVTGNSFREIGGSAIDLLAGNRSIDIASDVQFYITAPMRNGGLIKAGGGGLSLENYQPSTYAGPVTVNAGVLNARADGAFGTSAGGVTINSGGTVKLDSGWNYGDSFTVTGPGALIPGETNVREIGALIAEAGVSRITGAVALGGAATLAGSIVLDPSVAPAAGGLSYRIGTLSIEGAGGITGAGSLTLSGYGDGIILNGINTASGAVIKDGGGRWTVSGAGSYTGATTISAGALRISSNTALGAVATGTTVLGGALEITGGITTAEPFLLYGAGNSTQSGAIVNVSGTNTLNGTIRLGSAAVLRSDSGTLALGTGAAISPAASVSGVSLTLSGAGNGTIAGAINLGTPAASDALTKNGTGTWTINGAANFTGSMRINGGVLTIGASSSVLSPTLALVLAGGSLTVSGAAQTIDSVALAEGGGSVNGGTGGLTINAGISRSTGATTSFTGRVVTGTLNTNGILGGYATFGSSDWAAVTGTSLAAFSGYVPLSTAGAAGNAVAASSQTLSGSTAINSLKITGPGIAGAGNTLTVSSGGLMYAGNGYSGITGATLISGDTPESELIINTSGGTLDIGSPLIGAGGGGLTKSGAGNLILRSASSFTGPININGGTLSIVGPGGTTHPTTLGANTTPTGRNIILNGGTFQTVGGDFDPGINTLQYFIGSGGGTIRSAFYAQLTINDANQLRGPGDLTFTGGGRYFLSGGTPNFPDFGGSVTVDGGVLTVGNNSTATVTALGGRAEQTIRLKPGSAIVNNAALGLGANGLPNNIVSEGGVEFFSLTGNRVYGGDIQLSGTNTIALMERDTFNQERQLYFNGRVSGSGITLNVFGVNNANTFYLASGANNITGTINLNTNAVLEVRGPDSIGINTGDVTVNLLGANSRLFLRHWQNGDYHANVTVADTAEINSDRLVNYTGGISQLLSINNLAVAIGGDKILTFGGANGYTTRIAGTAAFNGSSIVNAAANALFENGITFAGASTILDKRGAGSIILRGPSTNTGATIVQAGFLLLQGATGSLPNSSSIELRGGELRVENSEAINTNRINDSGAMILGGGVLRITGQETLPVVTAAAGTTQVIYNPTSETVASALTLTGFTRQTGAIVQFQAPDVGAGAVGQATFGTSRISSRILIPGQANVTGTADTIPGLLGSNNLDFIQYDGTTIDNGQPLGVRDVRNPGNNTAIFPVPYQNDIAETAWSDAIVLRTSVASATINLTASRALDAWKIENTITTLNMGTNDLRIENGGILATAVAPVINGTTGRLYAGKAVTAPGVAELIIGGNNALTINSIISDNPLSGQPVALVKTGSAATLNLNGASPNTYTGGTYVTAGILNVTVNNALGAASNPITLSGGTLQLNVPSVNSAIALGGFGHDIKVTANSSIVLDNGTGAGTDNDYAFGAITINGPYTLGVRSYDSQDAAFTGTHVFSGTPTLDMQQIASGGAQTGFITLAGPITGTSGFFVTSSGNVDNTTSVLQIGAGEAAPNTYNGKVTVLLTTFTEDLRVELNKAAGTNAITGDLEINGGTVRNIADDQIANTSNMVINQGGYDAFGKSETIASVTMRGGNFRTSSITAASATPNSTVTVTGDFNATGLDDIILAGYSEGIAVVSNTTLAINGTLRLNGYSKGTVGLTSNLFVGGLELTGNSLLETGAGSLIRLNGNVTTFASTNVARLGATTAAGAQTELNGVRTFTIADGPAGLDMSVSTALIDSTSPVAAGGLIKSGPGVMQLEGSALANNYTGPTAVNEGALMLFKSVGINSLGSGDATNTLTIGDGIGGVKADKVIVRNSNQIADATNVTVASSGQIDLQTFDTSETIGSLSGSGAVDLGPNSAFVVSGAASTVFGGSISGAGTFAKDGTGTLELSAASTSDIVGAITVQGSGKLIASGLINGSVVVSGTSTLGGTGTIKGSLIANSGAVVSPGNGLGVLKTGSFSLLNGSTLKIEIGSNVMGTGYDAVNVTGSISLDGALEGSLINGFNPNVSDRFYVMINDGVDPVIGTFTGLDEGSLIRIGSTNFFITYTANSATGQLGNGNDVALVIPEPNTAAVLLAGLGTLLGLQRFRRRSASRA